MNVSGARYEVSGERYEIPRYARNDGVVYETWSAAAVNAESLFCPCAAATSVNSQRVIPNEAQRSEESRTKGGAVLCCLRVATSAGDADAVVRWDSCPTKVDRYKIRFLKSFYIQEISMSLKINTPTANE